MKRDSTAYGAVRPAWDKQDCSVRALAVATGSAYDVASMVFSARGRRIGKGTQVVLSQDLYENVLGMQPISAVEGMTLGEFVGLVGSGSFIVHKSGHAFAVVNGVVCDWEDTTSERTRIVKVWKVTAKAKEKMAALGKLALG